MSDRASDLHFDQRIIRDPKICGGEPPSTLFLFHSVPRNLADALGFASISALRPKKVEDCSDEGLHEKLTVAGRIIPAPYTPFR
jgi:hypothetical protein